MTPRGRCVPREVEGSPLLASPASCLGDATRAPGVERHLGGSIRRSLSCGSLPATSTPRLHKVVKSATCVFTPGTYDWNSGACSTSPWTDLDGDSLQTLEGSTSSRTKSSGDNTRHCSGVGDVAVGWACNNKAVLSKEEALLASPAIPPPWAQRFSQGDTPTLAKLLETPPRRAAWQASTSSLGFGAVDLNIPLWPLGGATIEEKMLPPPLPTFSSMSRPSCFSEVYETRTYGSDEHAFEGGRQLSRPRLPGPSEIAQVAEELLIVEQDEEIARFLDGLGPSQASPLKSQQESGSSTRSETKSSEHRVWASPQRSGEQDVCAFASTTPGTPLAAAKLVMGNLGISSCSSPGNSTGDRLVATDANKLMVEALPDNTANKEQIVECHGRQVFEGDGDGEGGRTDAVSTVSRTCCGEDTRPLRGGKPSLGDPTPEWYPTGEAQRLPCRFCGRQFLVSRLPVHEDACKQAADSSGLHKRVVFDSRRQRSAGVQDGRWWANGSSDATSWPAPDPKLSGVQAATVGKSTSRPCRRVASHGATTRQPLATLERGVSQRVKNCGIRGSPGTPEKRPSSTPCQRRPSTNASAVATPPREPRAASRPIARVTAAKSVTHIASKGARSTVKGGDKCGGGGVSIGVGSGLDQGRATSSPLSPTCGRSTPVGLHRAKSPTSTYRLSPAGGKTYRGASTDVSSRVRRPSRPDPCSHIEQQLSAKTSAQYMASSSSPPSTCEKPRIHNEIENDNRCCDSKPENVEATRSPGISSLLSLPRTSDNAVGLSIVRNSDESLLGPMMREVAELGAQVDKVLARGERRHVSRSGCRSGDAIGMGCDERSCTSVCMEASSSEMAVTESLLPEEEERHVARATTPPATGTSFGNRVMNAPISPCGFSDLDVTVAGEDPRAVAADWIDGGASSSWRPYDPYRYCAQESLVAGSPCKSSKGIDSPAAIETCIGRIPKLDLVSRGDRGNSSIFRKDFPRDQKPSGNADEIQSFRRSEIMDSLERQSHLVQDRIRGCAQHVRDRRASVQQRDWWLRDDRTGTVPSGSVLE